MIYSELVDRALRLSARAHRDQNRKASDLPYLMHPAAVTLILAQAGFEEEDNILAAALLHDVVEDTTVTLEELESKHIFPAEVIELVAELSEQKQDEKGNKIPWKPRKEHHLEVIRQSSDGACAIVLADKLHNLKSTLFDLEHEGPQVWDRFYSSEEEFLWYHHEMLSAADRDEKRIQRLIQENRHLLNELALASDGPEDK
ncbi:Bifunctional (p)ppGpp synthase/hydrolase SpoT [Polystyrenella longa]|uniref:Bifunctional (P)ppGpp synthase/hydrolase SpoT n=1 Tax=Polystyrenella longa TaxID=2528007 RepID=A0A518CPS0_9PLAN|nr:HD domain-containing protein [Polystyrenella longa]QDU81227.1 Bifunctional (p)ppGpp synthase/hydrolase SpoT [Polystyrenella longa]